MPASGGISLADANVWLAVAFSDHLHHATAKAWFEGQHDASCAFCRITQMALLRHLHPRCLSVSVVPPAFSINPIGRSIGAALRP